MDYKEKIIEDISKEFVLVFFVEVELFMDI